MIPDKFLPIGSVVLLKGGSKRIMINGYLCTEEGKPEETYDYCGCLFPEGFITMNSNLLFNHDQIEKVDHLGLIDEEEQEFQNKINELIKK